MSEWWLLVLLVIVGFIALAVIVYPLKKQPKLVLTVTPVVIASVVLAYYTWGSFPQWQQHLQENNKQALAKELLKSVKSPQELIDKLRAKLNDSPQSAKGWFLLAKLYSSQQQQEQAVKAFAKAHQLAPEEESYTVFYAHSLWIANQQQFNQQIRSLFDGLLAKNPKQPDALAMRAMDNYLAKNYAAAIDYWQRLLDLSPQQSEEAAAIRKAIAKAQTELKQR